MESTASILDPVQQTLSPFIWEHPEAPEPFLKPKVANYIRRSIYGVLEHHGYSDPHEWLRLCLTGSLTTYQYADDSDCDVSLFVDSSVFPEWSRAEMIGIMISEVDGGQAVIPGTPYPLQCFVVARKFQPSDLYKPGLRSGYDIDHARWIVPPDKARSHDIQAQEYSAYAVALEAADKMERLLRYEPDKATQFWHQIHARRMRDQTASKGDFSDSNIIYKFLAKRNLLPEIAQLTGEHIAAFTPAHRLDWQPGAPGKGFVLQDGSVWTWPTEHMRPPHQLVETRARMDGAAPVKRGTEFHIEPHGRVWQFNRQGDGPNALGWRSFDPDDRFNIMKSNGGLWFGQPGDEAPPNAVDDGYGHATELMPQPVKVGMQWDDGGNLQPVYQTRPGERALPQATSPAGDTQAMLDANAGQDLYGLPGRVKVPGYGPLAFHSNADIQRVANEYNQTNGLGSHPADYVPVNPQRAGQIAAEYERMPHNPQDPRVAQAYQALAQESMAQYRHAVNNGYQFEFYPEGQDPYPKSPREAVMDLHRNKHMYVYPTEAGYGQEQQGMDHPLLQDSGERWGGKPVTYNDIFRGIHDFYGHAKEGLGFRAHGEDNAYRQHAAMFSPEARRALASETRGQNSWVNFGPHGQTNQTANQAETVYAPQKAGLLPEWVTDPSLHQQSTFARAGSRHEAWGGWREPEYADHNQFARGWSQGDFVKKYPWLRVRYNGVVDHLPQINPRQWYVSGDAYPYAAQTAEAYARGFVHEPQLQQAAEWVNSNPDKGGSPRYENVLSTPEQWRDLVARRQETLRNQYINNPDAELPEYERHVNDANQLAAQYGVDPYDLPSGGTFARTAARTAASDVANTAYQATVSNGGITVGLDGSQPTAGFAYSPAKSEESIIPLDKLTPNDIDHFIVNHYSLLNQPGHYLGMWVEGPDVYLDLSVVNEDRSQAFQGAQGANQLAMYDLGSFEEIPVLNAA